MKIIQSLLLLLLPCSFLTQANTILTDEYTIDVSTSHLIDNQWRFDYSVTNNNQTVGGMSGLDGLSILIPESAIILGSTVPAPYIGAPGYWDTNIKKDTFNLAGNGSQTFIAPEGYDIFTWWGQWPQSVYQVGSTANFSITLDNVSVSNNLLAISSYFGFTVPTAEEYTTNQHGNYSIFIGSFVSPVAVPEPAILLLLLVGLALIYVRRLKINS
jgi:hypothetical protein